MPLSLGLRMGLSAGTSAFGWVPVVESSPAAVAFNGTQFALPAYGPELVTNGTVDTDTTGWVATNSTLSVVSGALRITNSAAIDGRATVSVTVTPGKLYEVRFTSIAASGANIAYDIRSASTVIVSRTNTAASSSVVRHVTPVGSGLDLVVFTNSTTISHFADIDNVSVREVMLGEMGTNLGASGYTMSAAGAATATESPTGQLNLTGDGANFANGDKQFTGLTVGAHYRIVFLMAGASNVFLNVGTSQGGTQVFSATNSTAGVKTLEFTATATTHWVRFAVLAASAHTVSSITIAEWTPRPTLRTASFSEVFAFTASSTTARTYVGADGLIKNDLAADAPRVDYSNGKARYLFENQSTNLCLRSADLSNATWTASGTTVTGSAGTAPDGTTTAARVQGTSGGRVVNQGISITSGTVYTISGYVKSFDGTNQTFALYGDSTNVSGDLTATSSWQRFSYTLTSANTGARTFGVADGAGSANYDILVWGMQVEAQSFASSYIPTTTATVTRLIETARFSPLVEAIAFLPGGTIRVQAAAINPVNGRLVGNRATNDGLIISGGSSGTNRAHIVGLNNASLTPNAVAGSGGTDGPIGAVGSYNSSGRALAFNGGSTVSDTNSAGVNTVLYLARDPAGSSVYGNGYYSSFALYPFRATNANVSAIAVAPT
jgi:hypothetical protein